MPARVGINGFGRIGRFMFRASIEKPGAPQVVAINDFQEPEYLAYLLKYDSAHGRFQGTVDYDDTSLIVNGQRIRIHKHGNPADIPWGDEGVDIVADCTGRFLSQELAQGHLDAGARKVILSAPAKDAGTPTFVMGVNHQKYDDSKLNNANNFRHENCFKCQLYYQLSCSNCSCSSSKLYYY